MKRIERLRRKGGRELGCACRGSVVEEIEDRRRRGRFRWNGTWMWSIWDSLQDHATRLLLALPGEESGTGGVLKHLSHALVGLGGALEVLLCANLLADILGLG